MFFYFLCIGITDVINYYMAFHFIYLLVAMCKICQNDFWRLLKMWRETNSEELAVCTYIILHHDARLHAIQTPVFEPGFKADKIINNFIHWKLKENSDYSLLLSTKWYKIRFRFQHVTVE